MDDDLRKFVASEVEQGKELVALFLESIQQFTTDTDRRTADDTPDEAPRA